MRPPTYVVRENHMGLFLSSMHMHAHHRLTFTGNANAHTPNIFSQYALACCCSRPMWLKNYEAQVCQHLQDSLLKPFHIYKHFNL